MGLVIVLGCFLIAFSPALALYWFVIAPSSQLVILTIGSSFFWLLSILVVALWWYIIPPLRYIFFWTIPWSVLIQEAIRFGFYKLYIKGETGFVASVPTSQLTTHPDELRASIALGLGAGLTHSFISYVSILWEATGPGTYYAESCPSVNIFIVSALYSLCFILFHVCWAVIGFEGFKNKKRGSIAFVILSHLLISLLTLLNQASCGAALALMYIALIVIIVITFVSVIRGRRIQSRTASAFVEMRDVDH